MTVQISEFMQMLTFNKQERANQLSRDTNGIIGLALSQGGDVLIIDVSGTKHNAEIASRQVAYGEMLPTTSRIILRDHIECKAATAYEASLKHALVVGIIANEQGEPVLTFEANKRREGWQVSCKKYTYMVDKVIDARV